MRERVHVLKHHLRDGEGVRVGVSMSVRIQISMSARILYSAPADLPVLVVKEVGDHEEISLWHLCSY